MHLRFLQLSFLFLSCLAVLVLGCSASEHGDEAGSGDSKDLVVYVTDTAQQAREKALFYGLNVKTLDSNSDYAQLIQTLINSPSNQFYVVINPYTKRFITGGAVSDQIDATQLEGIFREMKQVSKAGSQNMKRMVPAEKGNARLLVFSDFQCPYCKMMDDNLLPLEEKFGERLQIDMIHFPLPMHDQAFPAAEASECARMQGKFDQYRIGLFGQQGNLSDSTYRQLASNLGLNQKQFSDCLSLHQQRKAVRQDQYFGQYMGVRGTPTLFLNGEQVMNSSPDMLQQQIQAILDNKDPKEAVMMMQNPGGPNPNAGPPKPCKVPPKQAG